jgi:hypothetical protein
MTSPMAAWRNLDGTYTLRPGSVYAPDDDPWVELGYNSRVYFREVGGRRDDDSGLWVVPESALARLGARRIHVVILAGYCCSPARRFEARDRDIGRGKVFRVFCATCGKRPESGTLWEAAIVEVRGEGEEGQQTYESAFQAAIEGR